MRTMDKIDKDNIADINSLTPLQGGILFHCLKETESNLYFEQLSIDIAGEIDLDLFQQAWNKVIKQNSILRTVFRWQNIKTPVQIVLKEFELRTRYYDFSQLEEAEREQSIIKALEQDIGEKFDLNTVPFRIALYKIGINKYKMVISNHHILYDGWSNGIILEEFFRSYDALSKGEVPKVYPKTQFKEFIKLLLNQNLDKQKNFWQEYLKGFDAPIELCIKNKSSITELPQKGVSKYQFDKESSDSVKKFVNNNKITLASLFYSVWGLILQKYCNSEDVVFGTTVSGRSIDMNRFENVVGLFINTLPMRIKYDSSTTYIDLIKSINTDIQNKFHFENSSLLDIKKWSSLKSNQELFNTIVVVENYPLKIDSLNNSSSFIINGYKIHEETNYDITVVIEAFDNISISLLYNEKLYDSYYIEKLLRHLFNGLSYIINNPCEKLISLDIMSKDERLELLYEFNNTNVEYEKNKTIHEMFSTGINKTKKQTALIFQNKTLAYEELDERSNQLAHILRRKGIEPNTIVGVFVERSMEMMIGIFAILKAGGAYLPIASNYPKERIDYILSDSGAKLILVQEELISSLGSVGCEVINLNDRAIDAEDISALVNINTSKDLAYVIYTSGSTGQPKGVMIEHHSVINRLAWMQRQYPIGMKDVILHKTPIVFDVSVWELFWWSFTGAAVCILNPKEEGNPQAIVNAIKTQSVTTIHFVPSMLNAFLDYIEKSDVLHDIKTLKRVFVSGEALTLQQSIKFENLISSHNATELINLYGPTEATVDVSYFNCTREKRQDRIPIGKPIDNTSFYIVDKNLQLQPIGLHGELCISGVGLARGYLNRYELNREKFIQNPFVLEGRMYRTGDLARWLPDGNVEYLGRLDHQVKVRGFRIELDEIDYKLSKYNGVNKSVTIVKNDNNGEPYISSYVVAEANLKKEEIKDYLKKVLPEYMIPNYIVFLDELPVTSNGKLDRRVLPDAHNTDNNSTAYVKPESSLEKVIAEIWQEVLGRDAIGVHDNFFDVGGDSLKIIRLSSSLTEKLQKEVTVADLFRYTTISRLSNYLMEEEKTDFEQTDNNSDDTDETEIAVIGMAGRFPAAEDIEQFWKNLIDSAQSISFMSEEELEIQGISSEIIRRPEYVKAKGLLEGVEYFDASFFEYSPKEAELMDPQLRILHECTWEAIENSGYNPENYTKPIGVYLGASPNYHWLNSLSKSNSSNLQEFTAMLLNEKDFYATRVAYKLNLKGPAITLQTACSTSLVSINMACNDLISRKCHMALAGGISITYPIKSGYLYQEGMIFSPDGHCRPFDEKAAGTVQGNGVGLVVLKKLKEAMADGDTIYAVIKGSAINNDGSRKVGYTAPSIEGQTEVIKAAQVLAKVEPESISYIETHGTATTLGDYVELEALKTAFNRTVDNHCAIGSVKSNVGHLDAAAGVTGFIKTVLSLKNKVLPPSLHFVKPNPRLDLENSPFYVNTKLKEWKNSDYPLRAGVSSFGMGGTNAHVILEEAPLAENYPETREWKLVVLSAKTEASLKAMINKLSLHFKANKDINLSDVAYTLQTGRKEFKYRYAFVCKNLKNAVQVIEDSLNKQRTSNDSAYCFGQAKASKSIIFMFPGQGSQYINMGRELYEKEPIFRNEMETCFEQLKKLVDYDIKKILFSSNPEADAAHITQTAVAQTVIFIIEYSLAKLLMKLGIQPQAMIGHSIGEYVAACISGVFKLEDALKLVTARGRLMQKMPKGRMLSVPLSEEQLSNLIWDDELDIAAVNTHSSCVVSGKEEAVSSLEKKLQDLGYMCKDLHTSHAFHSYMMEPMLTEFQELVGKVELGIPQIPYVSNLTGDWVAVEDVQSTDYWAKHLRHRVRFYQGIKELMKLEDLIFIEVGPGNVLSSFIKKIAAGDKDITAVNIMKHAQEEASDVFYFADKIGQLWTRGVEIEWNFLYQAEKRRRIPLPAYAFERKFYWPNNISFCNEVNKERKGNSEIERKASMEDWGYVPVWQRSKQGISSLSKYIDSVKWLVFSDGDLGSTLIQRIKLEHQDVVEVRIGDDYKKESNLLYYINPGNSKDHVRLMQELRDNNMLPEKILHLWNINTAPEAKLGIESVETARDKGFYSLIYIAQALGGISIPTLDFFVVTNNMQDILGNENTNPEKSAALAFVKICPLEYNNINCKAIDINVLDYNENRSVEVIDNLYKEITLESFSEKIVAYRNGKRWTQVIKPVPLNKLEDKQKPFRQKGVYFITGGLGAIGLAIGRFLALSVEAKLILMSRSPFPEKEAWEKWLKEHDEHDSISKKIKQIEKIEQNGTEVMIFSGDISDLNTVKKVVCAAEEKLGEINGIIHAAGVADNEGIIQNRVKENMEKVIAPKIKGTMVLNEVFNNHKLDLFLLCSSIGNISYHQKIGQIAYSAANEFLDAFAEYKTNFDGVLTIAVNWPDWQDAGMSLESAKYWAKVFKTDTETILKDGVSDSEGIEVFQRIVNSRFTRIAISPIELIKKIQLGLQTYKNMLNRKTDIEISNLSQATSVPDTTCAVPVDEVERKIAEVWQRVLGLERVGANESYFDLGASSLDILQVNSILKEEFKRDIPIVLMYSYPTISAFARYLKEDNNNDKLKLQEDKKESLDKSKEVMKKAIFKMGGQKNG